MPLLKVSDLEKTYSVRGKRVKVVKDVSLAIERGEVVGLIGASGCGKSTTARCILQLDRADRGTVAFEGADLCSLRGRALRKKRSRMQVVFQDPLTSLDPRHSLHEIVREPLLNVQLSNDEQETRIKQALELVGLDHLEQRRPHEISTGQAQRVAVARAIVSEPSLVICDEATSALDVSIQAQVLNLLREIQQETGVSYLFISHDFGVVNVMCDRVLVMENGEIIEEGPTSGVLRNPQHVYTSRLIEVATALGH